MKNYRYIFRGTLLLSLFIISLLTYGYYSTQKELTESKESFILKKQQVQNLPIEQMEHDIYKAKQFILSHLPYELDENTFDFGLTYASEIDPLALTISEFEQALLQKDINRLTYSIDNKTLQEYLSDCKTVSARQDKLNKFIDTIHEKGHLEAVRAYEHDALYLVIQYADKAPVEVTINVSDRDTGELLITTALNEILIALEA